MTGRLAIAITVTVVVLSLLAAVSEGARILLGAILLIGVGVIAVHGFIAMWAWALQ